MMIRRPSHIGAPGAAPLFGRLDAMRAAVDLQCAAIGTNASPQSKCMVRLEKRGSVLVGNGVSAGREAEPFHHFSLGNLVVPLNRRAHALVDHFLEGSKFKGTKGRLVQPRRFPGQTIELGQSRVVAGHEMNKWIELVSPFFRQVRGRILDERRVGRASHEKGTLTSHVGLIGLVVLFDLFGHISASKTRQDTFCGIRRFR